MTPKRTGRFPPRETPAIRISRRTAPASFLWPGKSVGKSVAWSTAERSSGDGGLWCAPLDQQTSPRSYYIAREGQGFSTYRINRDGAENRRVGDPTPDSTGGPTTSPYEQWVTALATGAGSVRAFIGWWYCATGRSMPPAGMRSEADLKKMPGVQMIPWEDASPGLQTIYAYNKAESLANLYRIPLR